ncbi:MAG: serpin family protein, partial [Candidatus Cloacimonadales bacterium]
LPKFKFEFATNLNAPLTQLGMGEAFGSGGLAIDQVMHKAIIDVNEEGTEAAAVTAVTMTRSMPQEYDHREFKADHPFIFVIQEEMTNNILFMGKVEQPKYEK